MQYQKNLALIGAGQWGKNLARVFHSLGVLHTICDARSQLLEDYASKLAGVLFSSDWEAVLQDGSVKKVAIAAPAALHYRMAKAALLAGKDVFVEKPLCLNSEQGAELAALAEERKQILMVGHLLQYHPIVVCLQEMIRSGALGPLHYIASHRLNLGQIRTEENNLWSFAPHDISVILSLVGGELPESLRCQGQAYLSSGIVDMAMISLEFSRNVQAHIYTSWLHPFKEQKLVVVGGQGMIVFDDTKPWHEKLLWIKHPVKWQGGLSPSIGNREGEYVSVAQKEPLEEECKHFIECCSQRSQPKTNGREGLQVLRVLEGAQQSLERKGERWEALQERDFFAHPTAVIDSASSIGKGTNIWHFSHVMKGAKIGDRCNIGQNVVISPDAHLGCNVKVQNNVSVYTGVVCEDDVFLGPSMVFTNVRNPRSAVNRRGEYQRTIVRRGATIGANATIVCGIELGRYCFIGAGAVVTKSTKPFALMVGNPAKQIGWMSRFGEKLDLPLAVQEGDALEALCPATQEAYVLTGCSLELKSATEEKITAGVQ